MNKQLKIRVPLLARVEGEGALDIDVSDGKITNLKLRIFEPPRLFEKLLVGKHYSQIPDMVARICGICPVAYQISAVLAIENLFQTQVTPWISDMRRLFYCGEWIQSHALHIHLLALPDYFGANSVVELAATFPDEVRRGMELQALGNQIIKLFGARSINPVGIQVGGFSQAPEAREAENLAKKLDQLENAAVDLLQWICQLQLPDYQQELVQFSLSETGAYPMMSRSLIGSQGRSHAIEEFEDHFKESQLDYSTAFHSLYQGQCYLVGPLARINLNSKFLRQEVISLLQANQLTFPFQNNYYSIVARAAELYHAVLTAKTLLSNYQADISHVDVSPKAGVAIGCSEAPRGLLWHRYEFSAEGVVNRARIVPPTSQNQAQIEEDIRFTLEKNGLTLPEEQLQHISEQVIRNYDPCISCATHFLRFKIQHEH